jgi:hypothetical protein
MAGFEKRPKEEKESLVFDNPELAHAFKENVGEKLQQPGEVTDRRQVVADAVGQEFQVQGQETVSVDLTKPWQHTPQEHTEVQHLADVAFAKNLKAALSQARGSDNYPRNIDLLHDVLTGEMHEALLEHKINKQPILGWIIFVLLVVALLGVLLVVSINAL